MKKFNKVLVIILTFVFIFGLTVPVFVHAATAPNLGAAAGYSVFGNAGITETPAQTSHLWGDVGGNGLGNASLIASQVDGSIDVGANVLVVGAISSAYSDLAGEVQTGSIDLAASPTVVPGVYDVAATTFNSTLTLNGAGVYIFRSTSSIAQTAGGTMLLTNGACADNVFWQIPTSMTFSAVGNIKGTIITNTGLISFVSGVSLKGRAWAATQVTMDNNQITEPVACAAPTATLTLVKTITNDNGGTKTVTDFPLTATGATTISGVSGTASVTAQVVNTGTYTLSETIQTGYTPGSWSCTNGIVVNGSNQITLSSGDVTTCTITNDDIAPQLIVTKTVINNNNGTKVVADFPLFIDAVSVLSGVANITTIGLHTVTETSQSDYTASVFGGDCAANGTITLSLGDIKTCTITNDDIFYSSGGSGSYTPPIPPLIDVVKVPSPLALPAGPGAVAYTYTLRNIGTVPVTNITMVGDTCSPIILASGDTNVDSKLDVTETWVYKCSTTLSKTHTNIVTTTGWANGISTTDIASATVVVGASIVPPLIHVTKIPNPVALTNGGLVTYNYTVTNPGTVPLSNVSIVDDKCTGLPGRVVGHPGDLNKNNLLESNESWSFTCKSNIYKTTTNTATASGDANGLTAKDFAIATVVVTNIPGLPKTGFGPENNISWNIIISAGILGILISFYLARKKQTN